MATPQTDSWNTSTHMDREQLFPYVDPYVKKRASQPAGVLLSHTIDHYQRTGEKLVAKRKGPLRRIYSSRNVVVEEARRPRVEILTGRLPLRRNAIGSSRSARVLEECLQRSLYCGSARPPTTSPSPEGAAGAHGATAEP